MNSEINKIALFKRKNKGEKKSETRDIEEEWHRMFVLNQFWKVNRVDDDKAYCKIHFKYSLEQTGHIEACYRLMDMVVHYSVKLEEN